MALFYMLISEKIILPQIRAWMPVNRTMLEQGRGGAVKSIILSVIASGAWRSPVGGTDAKRDYKLHPYNLPFEPQKTRSIILIE